MENGRIKEETLGGGAICEAAKKVCIVSVLACAAVKENKPPQKNFCCPCEKKEFSGTINVRSNLDKKRSDVGVLGPII